ncbi:hypothetical protein L1987_12692 [Smallanthus sonchifolius]|uniref:Uncharacterized protein n=1 Tax=Smallanthus sonchifolius TaxID=185202 RepID=A0ACB9JFD2_9ASTR|nr:hypothetical protein L1987_12692 [Smallanthus sonchifolius]
MAKILGMAYSENSTTNIANISIEITEVVDSRAQFDVNQVTEHNFVVQNTQMSSSVDIASTSDSSVHALLEFTEGITRLCRTCKKWVTNHDSWNCPLKKQNKENPNVADPDDANPTIDAPAVADPTVDGDPTGL